MLLPEWPGGPSFAEQYVFLVPLQAWEWGLGLESGARVSCVVLQAAAPGPHAIWQRETSIIVRSVGKDKSTEKIVAHLSSARS